MARPRIARRYIRALFAVAQEQNLVDGIAQDVAWLLNLLTESPALLEVLRHPRIDRARKRELLESCVADHVCPLMADFLFLIVDKDRAGVLEDLQREFERMLDAWRGVVRARAVTAVPMTDAEKEMVRRRVAELTGLTVMLESEVRPEVLGGIIVEAAGKLIDGSVVSQLSRMRERLRQVRLAGIEVS